MRKAGFQEVQTKACSRDISERVMSRDIQKKDYKEMWTEEIQDRELQRGTRGHEDRLRKKSSEEVPE